MASNEEKKVLRSEAEVEEAEKESRELLDSELEEISGGQTVPQGQPAPTPATPAGP